jgi:signal peptidase II
VTWLPAPIIALVVAITDRLTKVAIMRSMTENESIPLIPGVLHLTYIHNTGAAFGLFQRGTFVLIGISVAVVVMVVAAMRHPLAAGTWARLALGLVLGGAIGNLYDRVVFGYVVDFLDVRIWPVFNVADSCLVVGGILVFFTTLFGGAEKRTRDS